MHNFVSEYLISDISHVFSNLVSSSSGRQLYIQYGVWEHALLPTRLLTPMHVNIPYCIYRGSDKSLARPTSRCILFDGENISCDASLVIYIYIYIYIYIVLIFLGAWGGVVVKALRYWSGIPGIDSRWCHWGFFPWSPRQNHVSWGRLSLWKWVPGISRGVKAAGAFGWQPTTLVVPKRQENPGP